MASDIEICNLALARIGVRVPITSLTENSAEAEACSAVYDMCRQLFLASGAFAFATKRVTLAALASATRTGWGYVFALPTDLVELRSVYAGLRTPTASQRAAFSTELNDAGDGRVLLSDDVAPEIQYTADVPATLFPPLAADAFAWLLARELSMSLAVKPDLRVQAAAGFEAALSRAMATSLNEGNEAMPESDTITARY